MENHRHSLRTMIFYEFQVDDDDRDPLKYKEDLKEASFALTNELKEKEASNLAR